VKRASKRNDFSALHRALCTTRVVESKRVRPSAAEKACFMSHRLRLETIGCESSPIRGLVAPVAYHREEKE
jgi:hypothetical protein